VQATTVNTPAIQNESVNATDLVTATIIHAVSIAELVSAADSTGRAVITNAGIVESATVTDIFGTGNTFSVTVVELVYASETQDAGKKIVVKVLMPVRASFQTRTSKSQTVCTSIAKHKTVEN
jgi:hypothetical protein